MTRTRAQSTSRLGRPGADIDGQTDPLWRALLPHALLVGLVACVFFQTCIFEFLFWDDQFHVSMNPDFSPPTVNKVLRYWQKPHEYMYIPLTYTVWGTVSAIAPAPPDKDGIRLNPYLFHTLNVGLHMASVLIVFGILEALGLGQWPAAFGAALFAIHPVQVETVAWVSGLRDLLCTLLALLALRLYIAFVQEQQSTSAKWWIYPAATICFALSMLAKPSTVVLPLLAMTLEAGLLGGKLTTSIRRLSLWLILVVPVFFIARTAQGTQLQDFVTPLAQRPLIALDATTFYLLKILLPLRLCLDYARKPEWVLAAPFVWITAAASLAVGGVILWLKRRWLTVSALLFVLAILPTSGLQPFVFQNYSTVTDHYLYLAMFAVALAGAAGTTAIASATRDRRPLIVASVGLILLLSVRSALQASTWHDTRTVFAHALRINPHSWIAQETVARYALEDGDAAAAETGFRESIRLRPRMARLYAELGASLAAQHREAEAIAALNEALRRDPTDLTPHGMLGDAWFRTGDYQNAVAEYAAAMGESHRTPQLLKKYADAMSRLQGNATQRFP